jgi:hypothetical protein
MPYPSYVLVTHPRWSQADFNEATVLLIDAGAKKLDGPFGCQSPTVPLIGCDLGAGFDCSKIPSNYDFSISLDDEQHHDLISQMVAAFIGSPSPDKFELKQTEFDTQLCKLVAELRESFNGLNPKHSELITNKISRNDLISYLKNLTTPENGQVEYRTRVSRELTQILKERAEYAKNHPKESIVSGASNEVKVGSVVRLKSGGPDMTVISMSLKDGNGVSHTSVGWFPITDNVDDTGTAYFGDYQTSEFPDSTLNVVG